MLFNICVFWFILSLDLCFILTCFSYALLFFLCSVSFNYVLFFFKQKTAYELRISDWSSDVCSSDLAVQHLRCRLSDEQPALHRAGDARRAEGQQEHLRLCRGRLDLGADRRPYHQPPRPAARCRAGRREFAGDQAGDVCAAPGHRTARPDAGEEHCVSVNSSPTRRL